MAETFRDKYRRKFLFFPDQTLKRFRFYAQTISFDPYTPIFFPVYLYRNNNVIVWITA